MKNSDDSSSICCLQRVKFRQNQNKTQITQQQCVHCSGEGAGDGWGASLCWTREGSPGERTPTGRAFGFCLYNLQKAVGKDLVPKKYMRMLRIMVFAFTEFFPTFSRKRHCLCLWTNVYSLSAQCFSGHVKAFMLKPISTWYCPSLWACSRLCMWSEWTTS